MKVKKVVSIGVTGLFLLLIGYFLHTNRFETVGNDGSEAVARPPVSAPKPAADEHDRAAVSPPTTRSVELSGDGFGSATGGSVVCHVERPCRVLLWGDSLTEGMFHTMDGQRGFHPYEIKLRSNLERLCAGCFELVQRGISGERTGPMLGRLREFLSEQAAPFQFAVILGGTNDLKNPNESAEFIVDRVRQMVMLVRGSSTLARALVLGLPEYSYGQAAPIEAKRLAVNEKLKARCASIEFCVWTDLSVALPAQNRDGDPAWSDDGVHYSPEGYDMFGDLVYSALFIPLLN